PDFDWNDFTPGARAGVTQPDGSISALAAFIDANVVFYRKDLFGSKGVTPPKTLADLEPLVQKLHAPPATYGIVLSGLKNANATQYPSILFPMGGTYLKDGKAALDTKEQVSSLGLYARLLRQYGPPGVVNFNWYECSASFMQGQVAMYMDGVNFASQFEDAAKSKVVGKVGYAVLPSGPGGHFSPIYITGMAVNAQSRNHEAAYLFAQWATNKTNMVRELIAGVGVGRTSTWDSPDVKAKPKMPADWYQAYQASLKIGRQGLPEIVGVTEYRDIIGVAIQKGIEGAPAAQVLAQAQKEFQDLLNRTESQLARALSLGAPSRVVALSGAGGGPRRGDHRLPDRLHGLDEPPRVVRLQPDRPALHRPRELRQDRPRRRSVPRGRGAHPLLHHARGRRRDVAGRRHGPALQSRILGAGVASHARDPADGGDAHGHRARVRDDVSPDARRGELPGLARGPVPVSLDVLEPDRPLCAGARRRLAVDAADHAHRARRPREPSPRAVRGRPPRRRHASSSALGHHAAAAPAGPRRGHPVPRHRRAEDLRHHLRHDPGRAGQLVRDHQHPALQPGVLVLQHGLLRVHGGGALRARHGRVVDLDQGAEEHDVGSGGAGP